MLKNYIALFILALTSLSSNALHIDGDTTRFMYKAGKVLNLNDSLFSINIRTLPYSALNYKRFNLVSDHNPINYQYKVNSGLQNYLYNTEEFQFSKNILDQYNSLFQNLAEENAIEISKDLVEHLNTISDREVMHSIWRSNLVKVENEIDLYNNVSNTTRDLISAGYNDLTHDLLPLITMLMLENKLHHYEYDRVISTKKGSRGIVDAIEIMNALESLDNNVEAGVCRDVHDMGLRVLRPMYQVYLDENYPESQYNADDYIFLHAWVTPSSQHVTLVAVDPENTRNYHELDWGRIYKKEDQEGIEIGKMIGTTIRLWKYNPKTDVTEGINLLKSQWGLYLDNNILNKNEDWLINGIYNPRYTSTSTYRINAGRESQLGISVGMLNAREKVFSFDFRSGAHQTSITRLFRYEGLLGFQGMVVDDTHRKSNTLTWAKWNKVVNFLNSARYISKLKTTPLQILPGLNANLFAVSQLEVEWSMTHFNSDDEDFNNKLQSTGDANLWINWGGELSFSRQDFNIDLKYGSRNFLIASDVRLHTPNPVELFRSLTVANSGSGLMLNAGYHNSNWQIDSELRYETNQLDAEFILYSLKIARNTNTQKQWYLQVGTFNQVNGLEYYWYSKSRQWLDLGFHSINKFTVAVHSELIKNDKPTIGLSFYKHFK